MTVFFNDMSTEANNIIRPAYSLPSACFSWILISVAYVVSSRRSELWSQQGSILRSYFASWIGVFSFDVIRKSLTLAYGFNGLDVLSTALIDFGVWYFSTASVLWLNVMIFDVWKRIRDCRRSEDVTIVKSQNSRFAFYSIWVWGGSWLGILIVMYAMYSFTPIRTDQWILLMILRAVVFSCIYICNILLIISTAIMIGSSDRIDPRIKKWFISCVRLFVLTLFYDVLVIPVGHPDPFFSINISVMLETLHGIPIFLMFV